MSVQRVLMQPTGIGSLKIPNRIVMAPMGTGYADGAGCVTERLIAYHVARARGGVGLNMTEHTAVARAGLTAPTMLALYGDRHVEGFRRLCEAVHGAGGRIAVQLNHGGRQADVDVVGELVAPSEYPNPGRTATARSLSAAEVEALVEQYAAAAFRAQQAGVDGVEVHMAHGYMGCSFLSPLTNRRDDRYGGDTKRRCQFAREVFAAIRRRCGEELPLWCRISADELIEGGMTLDEAQRVAPILVDAGAQAVHVSGCVGETAGHAAACYYEPDLNLAHLAQGIKQVVDVPVIAVGRIRTPELADGLLRRGACDLVALGRPLLADPDWPQKAAEGREAEIIPCIACNIGCLHRRMEPAGLCLCTTNPYTGREQEWDTTPPRPAVPGRVLVVGGGPAGMSAAIACAQSGHCVELWEARERLGGAYQLACVPPGKGVLRSLIDVCEHHLHESGVVVRTGFVATPNKVAGADPDVAIVATGASSPVTVPVDRPAGAGPYSVEDLLGGVTPVNGAAVVIGGGRRGTEVAHFLAVRGGDVTLIERGESIAGELPSAPRAYLRGELARHGVRVLTSTAVTRVTATGVQVTDANDGREREVEAATVVAALPRRPDLSLTKALIAAGVARVETIGDARIPRSAQEAIFEGVEVARRLSVR